MINISDIIVTIVISLFYLIILPLQLLLFPMEYYSVKDAIYSGNPKKATGSAASRIIMILIICLIVWLLGKKDSTAIWGITIGSFLCAWPSIYHYQLFAFYKNRYKFLYFCACIASIMFSWGCASFVVKILLPVIFENKVFWLIDNNGIKTVLSVFGVSNPLYLRKIINDDEQDNPYLVSSTYLADMYLTRRKIIFHKNFFEQYYTEIVEAAEQYKIDPSLLLTVIQLEKINRGFWQNNVVEKLAVHFTPGRVIKKNRTLGLAQVSVKSAKDFFTWRLNVI